MTAKVNVYQKKERAFTLVEAVLALALFAAAAVAVSQICVNCLTAVDAPDKQPLDDLVKEQLIAAALGISEYDKLEDGTDVDAFDGNKYKVRAYAAPTAILDLFEVEIVCSRDGGEYRTKVFAKRNSSWYENANDREDIIKDRTDLLEDRRRQWEAPQ